MGLMFCENFLQLSFTQQLWGVTVCLWLLFVFIPWVVDFRHRVALLWLLCFRSHPICRVTFCLLHHQDIWLGKWVCVAEHLLNALIFLPKFDLRYSCNLLIWAVIAPGFLLLGKQGNETWHHSFNKRESEKQIIECWLFIPVMLVSNVPIKNTFC